MSQNGGGTQPVDGRPATPPMGRGLGPPRRWARAWGGIAALSVVLTALPGVFAAAAIAPQAETETESETEPEAWPSAEEIEELTLSIVNQPEFLNDGVDSPGFWEVLRDLLGELLRPLASAAGSEALAWLVLGFALLLVGWAISLALRDTGRGRFFSLSGGDPGQSQAWRVLEGAASSWEEAIGKARAALAAGRLYEAVWIAHRAFLAILDVRGAVSFAKWKTNRDYLTECPAQDRAYPLFKSLSQTYEEVVYGHRPVPPDRLEDLIRQVEEEAENG